MFTEFKETCQPCSQCDNNNNVSIHQTKTSNVRLFNKSRHLCKIEMSKDSKIVSDRRCGFEFLGC